MYKCGQGLTPARSWKPVERGALSRTHVAVEQPGARVVGDEVQAAGGAAQGAHAVGVPPLFPHHVAVSVDAVQVRRVALRAQVGHALRSVPL